MVALLIRPNDRWRSGVTAHADRVGLSLLTLHKVQEYPALPILLPSVPPPAMHPAK